VTEGNAQVPADLAVVVASYNVAALLAECLESIETARGALEVEVVVVDNDSSDGSQEMVSVSYPDVRLICNDVNEGFAKANNRAIKETRARYVLLLNPDTKIPERTLEPMIAFLDQNPDVGVVGPRVVRPDGAMDEACRRGFPTPLSAAARFLQLDRVFPKSRTFGSYRQTFKDPGDRYEVDSVVGAFMMLRRSALEDVGVLDEDFFMFGEDLDWCWRFKKRDWRIYYLGDQEVIHHKGASCTTAPHRMNWHFHRSMVLFHRKHLVQRYPFFLNWIVYGAVGIRYALKSVVMVMRGTRARRPEPVGVRESPASRAEEASSEA